MSWLLVHNNENMPNSIKKAKVDLTFYQIRNKPRKIAKTILNFAKSCHTDDDMSGLNRPFSHFEPPPYLVDPGAGLSMVKMYSICSIFFARLSAHTFWSYIQVYFLPTSDVCAFFRCLSNIRSSCYTIPHVFNIWAYS